MIVNYDTQVAEIVGANAATIFHNICFWVYINQKNERNFFDGKYWVYNSRKAWSEIYSHMNDNHVRLALDKLEEKELIISGYYSEDKFDRTKWYSIGKNGLVFFVQSIGEKSPMTRARLYNLSDNIHNNAHAQDNIINEMTLNKPKNTDEVIEEAGKRHCVINAEQAQIFIDKYDAVSNGGTWVLNRNVVTDWRKLVGSWVSGWREDYRRSQARAPRNQEADANDGRPSLDELDEQIRRERRERGQE